MKAIRKVHNSPQIREAIKNIDKATMRVGWGENIRYPDGESVAMIAAQNEFGNRAKNIPMRPFMRPAIINKGTKWSQTLGKGMAQVLQDKQTITQVFEKVGGMVVGDIKKSITSVTAPALKASTVEARINRMKGKGKGKKAISLTIAKPLVDTKYMLNSIIHEEVQK